MKGMFRLPHLGSMWMLVAAVGFAIMGALVKVGANKFSSAELVFYRSAFGLLVIYAFIFKHQLPLKTPYLAKQFSRAVVGFVSLVFFFYAIAHLPLATAMTLNYTSPLFLAGLVPFMLQQEHGVKHNKWLLYGAIVLGFIGVAWLLQPSFSRQDWFAGALGLLSGAGAGLAYIHVKQLGQLHEPDWRTVFYFTLFSTMCAGGWMLWHSFTAISWEDLPVLIGLGISATIGQLALTRAYRTGSTLIVASLAYTTVVFATLLGVIFWQETISLNEASAIGLIILSGIMSVSTSNNPHNKS